MWEIRSGNGTYQVMVRDAGGAVVRQSDGAVTSSQAARMLGKSRRHIYRYVRRGLINPLGKFLNEWLFDAGQIERFRKLSSVCRIPLRRPDIPPRFRAFFQDYHVDEMNPWTNAPLIITRILDTGTRRDWTWIFRHYPRAMVHAVVRDHGPRLMSARSHHFWMWLLGCNAARKTAHSGRPDRGGDMDVRSPLPRTTGTSFTHDGGGR